MQKRHDRWMFDSSIYSLSPPTFTRCQTISRMSVSQNDEQSVPELNLVKWWCKVEHKCSPSCVQIGVLISSCHPGVPIKMAAFSNATSSLIAYQISFCFFKFRTQVRTSDQMRTDPQITHHWLQNMMLDEHSCPAVQLCCYFVIRNRAVPDCVIDGQLKTHEINLFS